MIQNIAMIIHKNNLYFFLVVPNVLMSRITVNRPPVFLYTCRLSFSKEILANPNFLYCAFQDVYQLVSYNICN